MTRRKFVLGAASGFAAACTPTTPTAARGHTFMVVHGAWSGGWAWKKMHPAMAAEGHRLIVPTLTGLGEREHLASPETSLETHVQDVLGVIRFEQLRDLVVVAHSYGGMVATAVADRVPGAIRQLIYLDAFVPRDGQALLDLVPAETRERIIASTAESDGWRVAPQPIPEDTAPEDVQWIQQLRLPHPLRCFDMPVRLANGETRIPRAYVYALRHPPADTFAPFAARARSDGWTYREIDASHSPHVTAPHELAKLLGDIAT